MAEADYEVPKGGLPPEAYEQIPGERYPPYVAPEAKLDEFTVRAVVIGILLSVVFGAANAYLGLRVGLTVSASIPAAVMAVGVFRLIGRGTILESNVVQTIASSGESLAAGVIFTIPALFIWQRQDPTVVVDVMQVTVVAALGGLLGVLMMVPLRGYLINKEHGALPFPEGTACAEVQIAGQQGGSKAALLFQGLGIGALYQAFAKRTRIRPLECLASTEPPPQSTDRRRVHSGVARGRLHHRPAHRRDHVRGRRARVDRSHSGDRRVGGYERRVPQHRAHEHDGVG